MGVRRYIGAPAGTQVHAAHVAPEPRKAPPLDL
jgi:hypothetical protein